VIGRACDGVAVNTAVRELLIRSYLHRVQRCPDQYETWHDSPAACPHSSAGRGKSFARVAPRLAPTNPRAKGGLGHDHGDVRRVVILGRGGAGKSVLARQLGNVTGLPVIELDSLFWQRGLTAADPAEWAERQRELVRREAWILDGDLGPYDRALDVRLRAADTIIVLDFTFLRCAWRTIRRGRERAGYWRWVWAYRRQSLPRIMRVIGQDASHARVCVLRSPGMARCLVADLRHEAGSATVDGNAGDPT
jgi:adenylate kinase family enzyme